MRVKPLCIFKSSCFGLTILEVPHLSAVSKCLEIVDLPHHTPINGNTFFVWYVMTIHHLYVL